MGEIKATLSFHMDSKHNDNHDNRSIYVPHVDTERSKNNVYYSGNMTRAEAFRFLFADSESEFNARQTRPERRIENYLQKLLEAEERQNRLIQEKRSAGASFKELARYKKCVHPSMQFICTIGNMQDNPELIAKDGAEAHRAKAVLEEYMNSFQERNSNAFLYMSALHGDEASVWHGHFSIIWFADGCSKGMKRQVSQKRALEAMGFVSDTEKGEDGKLHLAIEKWQNREREILREICRQHGITVVAGNGSKEHLDREHYIIKKQKEENDKMLATVNDQAGIVLSAQEQVDLQMKRINDFINNTEQGKQFAVYSQLEDICMKADEYDNYREEQRKVLARLWEDYKAENSEYWNFYHKGKKDLYDMLQAARKGSRDNDRLIKRYLYALNDRSESLIMKLFLLIAVIALIIQKPFLDEEMRQAQNRYNEFKQEARMVLESSKETSIALKSKDFVRIENAMNNWQQAIQKVDQSLMNSQTAIDRTIREDR